MQQEQAEKFVPYQRESDFPKRIVSIDRDAESLNLVSEVAKSPQSIEITRCLTKTLGGVMFIEEQGEPNPRWRIISMVNPVY
ncbi:hypothetical protein SUGI_0813350 [Cryptomeria japonica]|nr:hypothetical protein SUGI_0813350 [Cryptomeria japonica]